MRALVPLALAIAAVLPGCAEPAAVVQLVSGADQALVAVQEADGELERAILAQVDGQMKALDNALLADMELLCMQKGSVSLDEVSSGMTLYQDKRAAIEQSRRNLEDAFARRGRNLQAARQLLGYAQDLVIRNRAAWDGARQYVESVLRPQSEYPIAQGSQP